MVTLTSTLLYTYLVGPADEGGVVGGSLEVEPGEPPEHYGIGDEMLRLFVARVVEAFDYQHPKDHLYGCGVSPEPPRVGVAHGKVGFHHREELIVVEQSIELFQLRFELKFELGHQLEEVYGIVSIDYHEGRASG